MGPEGLPRRGYRIQPRVEPRVEWREDKEDVGDLFCPGFAAKSRSNFKFSSLAKACLKV